jgi:RNA polymerase sigma factor for flagellar operon FliA
MPDSRGAAGPEQTLLANLPLIERVARKVCRRRHLSTQDAEDFESALKLKLVADDYAVLRKFNDRSRLSTYLCSVTEHYLLDYLDHLWGRWRPSAAAQRLGEVAVKLERLLTADRLSLAEACEVLRTNHKVGFTTAELEALAAQLPARSTRRFTTEDALAAVPASGVDADALVEESEQEQLRRRVEGALAQALEQLPDQDRLIIQMSLQNGMTAASIARGLRLDPKGIYRRVEQIRAALRRSLESQGVQAADVTRLLGEGPTGD